MRPKDPGFTQESEDQVAQSPEKHFLAGMLERAFWDLDYISIGSIKIINSSIDWFKNRVPASMPYWYVALHLDLSSTRKEAIDTRVAQAEQYILAVRLGEVDRKEPKERQNFALMNGHQIARVKRTGARHIF